MENTKSNNNNTTEKIQFMNEGNLKNFKAIKEQQLKFTSDPEEQKQLQKNIDNIQKGIDGENEVAYQLKKSHIPMYVLRNVRLMEGDKPVEIDFVVFTRKLIFVIECKNFAGGISVDEMGTFINKRKKEFGMENPLTQNLQHVILLKETLLEEEKNPIKKRLLEKELEKRFVSYVVFANKENILKVEGKNIETEKNIMRYDMLIRKMGEAIKESRALPMPEKKMMAMSEFLLNETKECRSRYRQKDMKMLLKAYRNYQKDIKGFSDTKYIFSDHAIEQIIQNMPENEEQIRALNGFGDTNTPQYAEGILEIVGLFRNME
ncbi:MAG: NERD domain-containing protein [Roseburia sp.]|nr:NERD domain-containing protein [Roseburia sp.]MCM1277955.1 NERD domain-containing protein [Robinsoniella sp.]